MFGDVSGGGEVSAQGARPAGGRFVTNSAGKPCYNGVSRNGGMRMHWTEIMLLAAGLAADACAVSMTNGMCRQAGRGWELADGLCFGCMQGVMPLLGYLLGSMFAGMICAFDHYIALVLLGFIGAKQIFEALNPDAEGEPPHLTLPLLLLQGFATSIDALAVGVGFAAFPHFPLLGAAVLIAAVTALLSIAGMRIGRRFGTWFAGRAQVIGGLLLIGIGVKIFIAHILST